jgi:UDP-N-acetyl-D-glucosamine 2-epimerase, UDP-hydrolysing
MKTMKKLAIVTTTRADYGLLHPIIKGFRKLEDKDFKLVLVVTGTHLAEKFGYTVSEIENDGFRIDYRIKIAMNSGSNQEIAENISTVITEFTKVFEAEKPDGVMILGDRYEMLGVATASLITSIPILHISGGDTTEGAIDENIRHALTKMSYLHFTTNEISKKRVIRMGEEPERVFNVGSTSIDNILNEKLLTKAEALESIGLTADKFIICTYHPVTLSVSDGLKEVEILAGILDKFVKKGYHIIVTKANADLGGSRINEFWDEIAAKNTGFSVFASLGRLRYLSLVKYASAVVGNSSSGIVEVPALKVPVINIGSRQKGRTRSKAVLEADLDDAGKKLTETLEFALSEEGRLRAEQGDSPYGEGRSAEQIVNITMDYLKKGMNLSKSFYLSENYE